MKNNHVETGFQNSYQFQTFQLINYLHLNNTEINKILKWRNSDDIRVHSYNQQILTKSVHLTFLNSLQSDNQRGYWLIKSPNQYIGVFNLKLSDSFNKTVVAGTDAAPELIGKGFGRRIISCIEYVAVEKLQMNTLYLEVLESNHRAIRLYEKCQFMVQRVIKKHDENVFVMTKHFH